MNKTYELLSEHITQSIGTRLNISKARRKNKFSTFLTSKVVRKPIKS